MSEAPIAAQAIARAMRDYKGCLCDDCLIPYLYEVCRPYMPDWGAEE